MSDSAVAEQLSVADVLASALIKVRGLNAKQIKHVTGVLGVFSPDRNEADARARTFAQRLFPKDEWKRMAGDMVNAGHEALVREGVSDAMEFSRLFVGCEQLALALMTKTALAPKYYSFLTQAWEGIISEAADTTGVGEEPIEMPTTTASRPSKSVAKRKGRARTEKPATTAKPAPKPARQAKPARAATGATARPTGKPKATATTAPKGTKVHLGFHAGARQFYFHFAGTRKFAGPEQYDTVAAAESAAKHNGWNIVSRGWEARKKETN